MYCWGFNGFGTDLDDANVDFDLNGLVGPVWSVGRSLNDTLKSCVVKNRDDLIAVDAC